MKRFTFEMFIESNDDFNMIAGRIDDLLSSAPYYSSEFSFQMTEMEGTTNGRSENADN